MEGVVLLNLPRLFSSLPFPKKTGSVLVPFNSISYIQVEAGDTCTVKTTTGDYIHVPVSARSLVDQIEAQVITIKEKP